MNGSNGRRGAARSSAEVDDPLGVMNRAAALTEHGDPLCCRTEWQLSYLEAFTPDAKPLFRESSDSMVAFVDSSFPDGTRILLPLDQSWLYGAPLLGPDAVELLLELLAEPAMRESPPTLWLSGLTPDGERQRQLVSALRRTHSLHGIKSPLSPMQCSASLEGGYEGYLSRRSGHFRRRLRSAERKGLDSGVQFERCAPTSATHARATFARMVAVEQQSWKGLSSCGMEQPESRAFYERMLVRLAQIGAGRVMFARHGGEDIGFIFGGYANGAYRGQQFSFLDTWRSYSI
ncbi:MAG: hypothetical protein RLZZ562_2970, partial [Planctomycetota bacterium]